MKKWKYNYFIIYIVAKVDLKICHKIPSYVDYLIFLILILGIHELH